VEIGDSFGKKKMVESVIAVGGKKGIAYIFPFSIVQENQIQSSNINK